MIKINIPVYFTENDDETINIDSESMREEFETKLEKAIGLYAELDKVNKRIKATSQKADMNELEIAKTTIEDSLEEL